MTPAKLLADLSLVQEIGQLLVVGASAADPGAGSADLAAESIGGVVLAGHSYLSVSQLRDQTSELDQRLAVGPDRILPLISVDQEGGQVQNLRGPGFTTMPSALVQGAMSSRELETAAHVWAQQLGASGISLDLAPVADVVPPGDASLNRPIGAYDREYGRTPQSVSGKVRAFVEGFVGTRTGTTVKHFPGLGAVRGNTDVSSDVRDDTTSGSPDQLLSFTEGMAAGASAVMVSSAIYDKIDGTTEAVFSPAVITGLLRDKLGWNGVVVSDDLGSARAVSGYSDGDRAVLFVRAGGDLVLTVDPSTSPAMISALLSEARIDPKFRRQVDRSVERILRLKITLGLVGGD